MAKINVIRNLCFIIFIAFSFYSFPFVANASTIGKPLNFLTLNTGLVGHWTFDGPKMLTNVADSSGNGNNGYLSGQVSTTTVVGKFGQALSFDGSNDYVSTGNFNVGSSNFTISVWLKKPSGTGDFYFLNQLDGSGNHWYLEIYNNKIYWHTTASGWVSGTNSVNIDTWNHIVIVGNDANTLFYLNGVLDQTGAKSSDISSANIPLFIGYNSNYGGYFNGSLDDVRIYNRVLSTTEIQQLYNLGSVTKLGITPKGIRSTGVQSGLISHWTFDGPKMITNVADSSGSGNNGYLINQISTTTIGGKIGQALLFDGVDDYVNIGTGNTYFPLSAFSICAWVKSPGLASGMNYSGIVSITYGLILGLNGSGQFSASIDNGVSLDTLSDTRNLYDNVFHHVCLAFNGTNKYISVDGISSTPQSQTWLGTTRWPTISAVIGHNVNNPPLQKFNGSIDDVRIYNRALSTTEIQQLYSLGATTKISATSNGLPSISLKSGLAGHWTFDGPKMITNVADSSGSGNNGYLVGQTSTTTVGGKIGQALSFDGVDDYVNCGTAGNNYLSNYHTLTAWVKLDNSIGSANGGVVQFTDVGSPYYAWELYIRKSDGAVGRYFAGPGFTYSSSVIVPNNKWTFVTIVGFEDATNGYSKVSINGGDFDTLKSGNTTGNMNISASTPCNIGRWSGNTHFFGGSIDDARIYNRELSANEIQQIYNQGR